MQSTNVNDIIDINEVSSENYDCITNEMDICIDDFVKTYANTVYRLAYSYTNSKVDTEDIF